MEEKVSSDSREEVSGQVTIQEYVSDALHRTEHYLHADLQILEAEETVYGHSVHCRCEEPIQFRLNSLQDQLQSVYGADRIIVAPGEDRDFYLRFLDKVTQER